MRLLRCLGQQAAFCFREAGISEICGKTGNALLYRRAAKGWTSFGGVRIPVGGCGLGGVKAPARNDGYRPLHGRT